ncbi:MAG: zinc ribbon domain-containing protein [Thermodesulfobacteriota bacterium]
MPIFEFECCRCGKEFERLVFASEEGSVACPECGSKETKKVVSVFSCSGVGKDIGGSCASSGSKGHS